MKKYVISISICLSFLTKTTVTQNLDPWIYANLPVKMNTVSLTYVAMDGNVISDPSAPLQDFNVFTNRLAAGYLRTFDFFGKLARVQLIAPFSFMSGSLKFHGKDTSGSRLGLNDFSLRLGVNIFGSPPLKPQDFRNYRQEAILGASLVLSIPLGQYYPERIINIGAHQWGFKPEIGVSLKIGQFYWETYGGVKFSTNNYEFLIHNTLKQSPIYSLQTHICHTFNNYMRIALSGTYVNGGETSINDVKQNDYIRHLRGGVSFGMSFGPFHTLVLQANTSITTNVSLDYKSISLSYLYTWF